MQNVFERRVLMNQADGEFLPLFISSSGVDFVYTSAMIIVSSISGNVYGVWCSFWNVKYILHKQ